MGGDGGGCVCVCVRVRTVIAVDKSAGFVIEKLRVPTMAEAVGEISSPELTFCADSYLVSVPPPCYCSGM